MAEDRVQTLTIRTPEGVVFSFFLAGPVTRFLAWTIDLAAIMVVSNLLGGAVQILGVISRDLSMALAILLYFIVSIGYGIVMEWYWRGQTLGKRLLRLRVMDVQGLRLEFSQIVIRNLLRFVDSLPWFYMVGGLACLISRKAQRLGDFAANTIVVRHPEIGMPDLSQILADKYNSFRNYGHLEARLRQKVTPQEAGLALQALLRRDQLDPEPRIRLFYELAEHFRSLVAFPPEAVEGISDEQYVRNVVSTVYRVENREK